MTVIPTLAAIEQARSLRVLLLAATLPRSGLLEMVEAIMGRMVWSTFRPNWLLQAFLSMISHGLDLESRT